MFFLCYIIAAKVLNKIIQSIAHYPGPYCALEFLGGCKDCVVVRLGPLMGPPAHRAFLPKLFSRQVPVSGL